MNFEFMTIDTPLPPCMAFPRALTGFPVSSTAKVMYCRMLDAILKQYPQKIIHAACSLNCGNHQIIRVNTGKINDI